MKTSTLILIVLLIIVVVVIATIGLFLLLIQSPVSYVNTTVQNNHTATTNIPASNNTVSNTPAGTPTNFDQTVSDGTIIIGYASSSFGLAVTKQQILVHSYIPPCDDTFNYCLYYIGTAYRGTNFESAGIRVAKRKDLTTQQSCLTAAPAGFDASTKPNHTTTAQTYAASVFSNVGGGAAGHIAVGSLYRLFISASSSCYELETRIGQSQFANFPAGSIKEFTAADSATVQSQLSDILMNVRLVSGETNLFAQLQ